MTAPLEDNVRELIQAAYNLSMFLRESVAPHDAGSLSSDWPIQILSDNEQDACRLAAFMTTQQNALAALGYPVI